MKKTLFIVSLFGMTILTSGCYIRPSYEYLEDRVYELENIIENCNYMVDNAQSMVWTSYEEMGEALESLEYCNY